jgi:hypothetical protein
MRGGSGVLPHSRTERGREGISAAKHGKRQNCSHGALSPCRSDTSEERGDYSHAATLLLLRW